MRCFVSFVCFMSVLVFVSSAPFLPGQISGSLQLGPGGSGSSSGGGAGGLGGLGGLTDILSQIDLPGLLRGVNSIVKLVGVFCPPLSQVLDNVIQNVTSTAFRVFGRAILQSGGLGGSSNNNGGNGGQKVSVVLPTFPPDEYDDEEEEESSTPAESDKEGNSASSNANEQIKQSADELADLKEGPYPPSSASETSDDASNTIAKRHVRVPRAAETEQAAEEEEHHDQEGAESAPEPAEDLSNVEDVDDQDRDKRYTADHGHAGSGNFLFDIIRSTADRAARTVGTVYRMVAGTENLTLRGTTGGDGGGGLRAAGAAHHEALAAQSAPVHYQLVAGSGANEEVEEKEVGPGVVEVDVHHGHEHGHDGEGIPGPITRLLVIANRGIANLVQDLILRLAQTSEKLVNFKARLITSLI